MSIELLNPIDIFLLQAANADLRLKLHANKPNSIGNNWDELRDCNPNMLLFQCWKARRDRLSLFEQLNKG